MTDDEMKAAAAAGAARRRAHRGHLMRRKKRAKDLSHRERVDALRELHARMRTELARIAKINTDEDRPRVISELQVWMWLQTLSELLPEDDPD